MAPFFRNSFACLVAGESPPEKKLLLTTFGEVSPFFFSLIKGVAKLRKLHGNFLIQFNKEVLLLIQQSSIG